jgi:hypothetical protein
MTTITRRGAFGAAAGAVAAVNMKATATDGAQLQTVYDYNAKPNTPVTDPQWAARKLAEARRIAAGEFDDVDGPKDGNHCPYTPLRSVSDAARSVMRDRRQKRMWREHRIKRAVEALKQYDATGVINTLF